jgi:uncharacterized protein YbjT (DUF2867 family)
MKVILFGSTGMIGQGVLRECLLDDGVESVLAIVRKKSGQTHEKLTELEHRDFGDLSAIESELRGHDACFFCLGVSAVGMSEADYTKITYDYALAAGKSLAKVAPDTTFIYVSGGGTDSSEKGGTMWARVKGKTENALLALDLENAYMFRPAFIQPRHGIKAKTPMYNAFYAVMGPFFPVWKAIAPKYVTTTEIVGRAMLRVAKNGADKRVLENHDINAVAG